MSYDYWKLEKVEWRDGRGIEDLATFGIGPVLVIIDMIDDITEHYEEGDHDRVRYLNFAVGNILSNMEKCIYRLLDEKLGECEIIRALEKSSRKETPAKVVTNVTKDKEASVFEDPRFWKYAVQIGTDGHNPADILEAWLKEHNPEHFEETEV